MLHASQAGGGMAVAPHRLAAQAGRDVLADGGNAIEAMVAAAAAISVVYPHMNGLGGDGFWLIHEPGRDRPLAISAIGAAGAGATPAFYAEQGLAAIPTRGALAANTSAGTVAGWQAALAVSAAAGGRLPLARLLEPAIHTAREGFPATESQVANTLAKQRELQNVPGWAEVFLPGGAAPAPGDLFKQPALAETLTRLAAAGLEDFYRGEVARGMAADLARAGSPVGADDLAGQGAVTGAPLALPHSQGTLFNVPPPSQGIVSLILLGLFDRLDWTESDDGEDFAHLHGLVEATKRAFLVRNAEVTDPAYMTATPGELLSPDRLDRLAAEIDPARALPWPAPAVPGDTVWLASADTDGRVVSFIHSIYWEFGSGLVLGDSGVQWQNRGSSFSLDPTALNALKPGRLPFHTNNPAMAYLSDGRVLAYGAMGGDGQPQTQAAVFTRYAVFGKGLAEAIEAPRWVLARTWGAPRDDLRLEARFSPELVAALMAAGHEVALVGDFDEVMGHAGALVRRPDGGLEGASDPRCDGAALGT